MHTEITPGPVRGSVGTDDLPSSFFGSAPPYDSLSGADKDIMISTSPARMRLAVQNLKEAEINKTTALLNELSPEALAASDMAMLNLVVVNRTTMFGGTPILELGPDRALASPEDAWRPCFTTGDIVSIDVQVKKSDRKTGALKADHKPKKERIGGAGAHGDSLANSSKHSVRDSLNGVNGESNREGELTERMDNTSLDGEPRLTAVVAKVGRQTISVMADHGMDNLDGRLQLTKVADEAIYNRMIFAISKLSTGNVGPVARLMLGLDAARVKYDHQAAETPLSGHSFNEPQQKAISLAVGSNVSVIHGPPGTGKTSTIVEIICQLVARGERVLVCGASNVAVDNIVERLDKVMPMPGGDHELLRLGHVARIKPDVLKHSCDLIVRNSDGSQILHELQAEIRDTLRSALQRSSGRMRGNRSGQTKGREAEDSAGRQTRHQKFKDLKELRKDFRNREQELVKTVIKSAKVVAATLHGAGSKELGSVTPMFTTVIIDEVSQALIPQSWLPAVIDSGATRLIVAGDNKQLPPLAMDVQERYRKMLELTLFDVLTAAHGPQIKAQLTIQYRMCEEIMEFPSKSMYQGTLIAHDSVATQRLSDLPGVIANSITESPILWRDTMTSSCIEIKDKDSLSTKNPGEAREVIDYIQILRKAGVKYSDIGVIAPYRAQIEQIRSLLPTAETEVEVSTVDGFQGREKEVIVLSMVRSGDTPGRVGFVSESRRINVAITRAKRHLCVIGNSDTLGGNSEDKESILPRWVEWCMDNVDIEYVE